jgi:hypothetical protein
VILQITEKVLEIIFENQDKEHMYKKEIFQNPIEVEAKLLLIV